MATKQKTKKAKKQKKEEVLPAGMGAIPHDNGVVFRVWAPHADKVSVIGTFNEWDSAKNQMKREGDGIWSIHVPEAKAGDEYKYFIINGEQELQRIDPYAYRVTNSIGNGIIYDQNAFDWGDSTNFQMDAWNKLVIYEMHVGTFNDPDPNDDRPGCFESAVERLDHLKKLGINAIQIMPPMEFAGGISWGYNPSHIFAIEDEYGGPDAFKKFIKTAHEQGLAIIFDVVYNHFGPSDLDLWRFDGWYENDGGGIYFYNDHRAETQWGHTRPDYGRGEVRRFIRDNMMMWLQDYHIDGLRFDATLFIRCKDFTAMEDIPEGWSLMQWLNEEASNHAPNTINIAEDLQNNSWITKSTGAGGAGFGSQWDAGFVHSLREILIQPSDEGRDIEKLCHIICQRDNDDAFRRVLYTESHDEVAEGSARMPEEIWPGNADSWFSKKRSTLGAGIVMTAPGVPMLFQGQEFLEDQWFRDTEPLDWSKAERFNGIVQLYKDLIAQRLNKEGLTQGLTSQYVHCYHVNNADKVIAFHRLAEGGPADSTIVIANFANRHYDEYLIGLPEDGTWHVRFDSDDKAYDEDFNGRLQDHIQAERHEYDGLPCIGALALAPYTLLILSQNPTE